MKKKRIAAAGLAVIMALTAAGCHHTSKEDTAQTTVKENRDEKDTSKEQIEKEETEKKVLHPYIHTDSVSGYVNSADGSVQINYSLKTGGLVLSDEEATAYPELNQALTLEYDTLKKNTQEDLNNLKESAEEMVEYMQGDDNMQLIAEYAPYVLRADENVVSYEQFYDDYYGGAHGYHSYAGFTFDTKTGKKLDLYDVITGEESVKAGIIQELKNKYASEDGLVENNTPEEDADTFFEYVDSKDQSGAVAWSLGADRLNIYYNPYNIGSWALGIVSVSLPFEKYPDAVKEEYKMGPSDYSVKIGIYADYSADIYNDGSFSDVSVYPDGTDDYANSALRIQIQDENGQVTSRVFDDTYYFTMEAYYVKTGNRHFLHVFTHSENDWTADNVYEITNGQIRDLGYVEGTPALIRYEYNYNEDSLFTNSEDMAAYNDPGALYLEKTMNAFSTYSGSRHYHVGSSGLLESSDPYVVGPAEIVVTVKKALTVKKTDASGRENGKTEVIPVGTKLYFYMTDNESYVIFRYDGDQYGKVSMYNSDWPQKINGEELESVLDGLIFAG
ncbi:MAG: RsiV family protein [Enterocloster sp.]|nr:RsiV family protein [Enterocloster sp.]